jgi:hypothetical protein
MPKFNRPCLTCGTLSLGSYCPTHLAQLNKLREAKRNTEPRRAYKAAMYGSQYRKLRQQVLANATHCHLCQAPFQVTDNIEADHLIPGDPLSPLAAAHRLCNQRRGNKPLA